MPLVQISVPAILSRPDRLALAEAVHDAMVATIDVPAADRFQIITEHAGEALVMDPAFPDTDRGAQAAIVHITLRRGRTEAQKRALYAGIAARAAAAGLRPEDVMVVLSENSPADWSFAEGVAQYAPAAA